jgi:hypothetical protein
VRWKRSLEVKKKPGLLEKPGFPIQKLQNPGQQKTDNGDNQPQMQKALARHNPPQARKQLQKPVEQNQRQPDHRQQTFAVGKIIGKHIQPFIEFLQHGFLT